MTPKPLALAQLLRLPNVFTAFADIALGALAAGAFSVAPWSVALLMLASGCLYLSGMGWNDFFDRAADARTQPFRPIPSGRVSARFAGLLAAGLMLAGVVIALAVTLLFPSPTERMPPVAVVGILAGVITLYNVWLKHTPLGPGAMGSCRALNVGLGLSAGNSDATLASALVTIVGVYIAGVTLFARTEESTSDRRPLWVAVGIVTLAGIGAALLPAIQPTMFRLYPYLLAAWAAWVGGPVALALREPSPRVVQRAVKRLIFGLVPLDAVLAAGTGGAAGVGILLLLVPATLIGRRVYST